MWYKIISYTSKKEQPLKKFSVKSTKIKFKFNKARLVITDLRGSACYYC